MALNAGTIWEVRATGSQANGGGFYNRTPGTSVDYSQQDAAQLTVTDLATDGAGTGLSSATGGFTGAMVGNISQIAPGSDLTAGWYEITAYTDTHNVTIDRSAGASKSGGTGSVGGAFLLGGTLDSDFVSALVAGNHVWVKLGSYTLGETVTGKDGGATVPICFDGYKTTRDDAPAGADRPAIDCGEYILNFCDNNLVRRFIFTGTAADVVTIGGGGLVVYCKSTNTSGTNNHHAISSGSSASARILMCEVISTNGYGIYGTGSSAFVVMCYAHDSAYGIRCGGGIIGCIADTCATAGIVTGTCILNNTIYNCGVGLSMLNATYAQILNNIIHTCTTGLTASQASPLYIVDYNCWYNNTDNTDSNTTIGAHAVEADPKLNDPDNGDFSLQAGSPCFGTGIQPNSTIGIV